MNEKSIDIFLICPVRNVDKETEKMIAAYVKKHEDSGLKVYWPSRDTVQVDPTGGIRICRDNTYAIIQAKEIHIWWNKESTGSKFDLGVSLAAVTLLAQQGINKKIVVANPEEVQKTEIKSFENVLLSLQELSGPSFLQNIEQLD